MWLDPATSPCSSVGPVMAAPGQWHCRLPASAMVMLFSIIHMRLRLLPSGTPAAACRQQSRRRLAAERRRAGQGKAVSRATRSALTQPPLWVASVTLTTSAASKQTCRSCCAATCVHSASHLQLGAVPQCLHQWPRPVDAQGEGLPRCGHLGCHKGAQRGGDVPIIPTNCAACRRQ